MGELSTRPTNGRPCPLLLLHQEALMSSYYVGAATRASGRTSLLVPWPVRPDHRICNTPLTITTTLTGPALTTPEAGRQQWI